MIFSFSREPSAMRLHQSRRRTRIATIALAIVTMSVSVFGQSGQSTINNQQSTINLEGVIRAAAGQAAAQPPSETLRPLSIDEAVKLALEQNLGIQIQRLDPQISDVGITQARSFLSPQLNTHFSKQYQASAATKSLAGRAVSLDNGTMAGGSGGP